MMEMRIQLPRVGFRRAALGMGLLLCVWGCSQNKPTTQPSTVSERAQSAIDDPFGYQPNKDWPSVSGGDTGHLDKKALDRDIDHVINP